MKHAVRISSLAFASLFLACLMLVSQNMSAMAASGAYWAHRTNSDVVFVFVHGVLSDSEAGWRHSDGTFWPDLIVADSRMDNPNIFMGGYPTSFGDPSFGIEDAARYLFGRLNGQVGAGISPVMSMPKIIFVAHSTGGLVVRQMLVNEPSAFANKKIGLYLLASPSRGSEWADRAGILSSTISHKMLSQLEINSTYTVQLDKFFSELLARKRVWTISGMDVFESRFILPGWLWNKTVIVNPDASRYYFGEPRLVPKSDHFSISKPSSNPKLDEAYTHEYLVEFYVQRFEPEIMALSQCHSKRGALDSFSNFAEEMINTNRDNNQKSLISKVQLSIETLNNSDSAIQRCIKSKIDALRSKRPFQTRGSVRCSGGGILAKGEKNEAIVKFEAPPNTQIVGGANVNTLSSNRGQVSGVRYDFQDGKTVGAEARVICQSPPIPFGPSGWAEAEISGTIENVPSSSEIQEAYNNCVQGR